ncbi:hypothetical protein ANRL1_04827 [Anaerolineae bacterium]|nr:hypothetical protein ANRL1_04827 [Anaerolineae bacterium]
MKTPKTFDDLIGKTHELRVNLWRRQARHNEENTRAHLAILAEIESLKREVAELKKQLALSAYNEYDALKVVSEEQSS